MRKFSLSLILVLIFCSPSLGALSAGFEGLNEIIYMKTGTSSQYKFQILSGDSVLPESDYTIQALEVDTNTFSADTSAAEFTFDDSSRYLTLSAKSDGTAILHVSCYTQIHIISTGKTYGFTSGTDAYINVTPTGEPDSNTQTGADRASGGGGCMMSHPAVIFAALLFLLRDKYFVVYCPQ